VTTVETRAVPSDVRDAAARSVYLVEEDLEYVLTDWFATE
jgi:hypothetical protein